MRLFFYGPQVTKFFTEKIENNNLGKDLIDNIFKILTSSTTLSLFLYLISKVGNFIKTDALTIHLFNTAFFYNDTDITISSDTEKFSLSLHNFSKNTVNVFFLGICSANTVEEILHKKDWVKNFIVGQLPKGPKSFEKVAPNGDSKLQIIEVAELRETLEKRRYFNGENGYKLCAVYYIQEDKNVNWVMSKKHFTLEYNTEEKKAKFYYKQYICNLQYYRLATRYRKCAATISEKDYKDKILHEADRLDPTVLSNAEPK